MNTRMHVTLVEEGIQLGLEVESTEDSHLATVSQDLHEVVMSHGLDKVLRALARAAMGVEDVGFGTADAQEKCNRFARAIQCAASEVK